MTRGFAHVAVVAVLSGRGGCFASKWQRKAMLRVFLRAQSHIVVKVLNCKVNKVHFTVNLYNNITSMIVTLTISPTRFSFSEHWLNHFHHCVAEVFFVFSTCLLIDQSKLICVLIISCCTLSRLCFFQTVLFFFLSFSGILFPICFTNCPRAFWCFHIDASFSVTPPSNTKNKTK